MRNKEKLPDRPIGGLAKAVRSVVRLKRKLYIKLLLGNKITWGKGVMFGKELELRPPQFIRLGNNVSIGPWFLTEVNMNVGSDVLISSRVSFIGNDHELGDPNATVFFSGRLPASTVTLGGDNLIGFGTIVVGSVSIGRGCIVGAGSVVTKDLPDFWICAGVPAKPLRKRFQTDS